MIDTFDLYVTEVRKQVSCKQNLNCVLFSLRGHRFSTHAAWGEGGGQVIVIIFITVQGGGGQKRARKCVRTKSMPPMAEFDLFCNLRGLTSNC